MTKPTFSSCCSLMGSGWTTWFDSAVGLAFFFSSCSQRASSSGMLKGFVMYASAPASVPRSCRCSSVKAVSRMTGKWLNALSARIFRVRAIPSITGICTSEMTSEGTLWSLIRSRASWPLAAISTLKNFCRQSFSSEATSGSSSTMSTWWSGL